MKAWIGLALGAVALVLLALQLAAVMALRQDVAAIDQHQAGALQQLNETSADVAEIRRATLGTAETRPDPYASPLPNR